MTQKILSKTEVNFQIYIFEVLKAAKAGETINVGVQHHHSNRKRKSQLDGIQ